MKIPFKLISFAFWVCFFTFARSQECLRSDIKLENTERLEQLSYSHGDTVKVSCIPGYAGMYKYVCKNGNWEKMVERACSKKKCGHPGDAQNGDFKLLDGDTEFVFGATVEYTCKKGFEMVSRINRRTCRNSGWDNVVPTCEVKKCPPIYAEGDITVSGNTEEGTYSDVIHFECLSPDQKISGKSNIHCTDEGEWSDPIPKCIEISCEPPVIPHGNVMQKTEYKKDATLQYECDTGYKPRQGTPKCTKFGWSLEPECKEIVCELRETKFGIQTIVPQGLTLFNIGDTVEITCIERYRIFLSKEKFKTFTCKQDGEWDHNPVCEEIRCELPRDRRLAYVTYYFYGELKLGETRSYRCSSGYYQMAHEATCTEDGWKPDLLCADNTCEPPNIPNAQILTPGATRNLHEISSTVVYNCNPGFEPEHHIRITCSYPGKWSGIQPCTAKSVSCATPTLINGHIHPDLPKQETIYYSCDSGYKPATGNWWEEARCIDGRWSDEPRCIKLEECGSPPSVANGQVRITNTQEEQSAEVKCDQGFEPSHTLIRCVNGTWEKPICQLNKQHCGSPPKVANAVITSKPQDRYSSGSHVFYICRKHFQMTGNRKVYCQNTTWDMPPTCEAFCPEPRRFIANGLLIEEQQTESKYTHGDTVRYGCADGYESRGETIARCDVHQWIYPRCIEKTQCAKPTKYLQFVTLLDDKNLFNNFDILTYTCKKPYNKTPGGTLMCENEKWNGTFDCTSSICPPPPYVENGEFNIEGYSDEVITKVFYTCQNYFQLDNPQKRFYKCQNRRWETPPQCLKPCKITSDIYREYNIGPVTDNYIQHKKTLQYLYCNHGWNTGGMRRREYAEATCSDGALIIKQKCDTENLFS